MLASLRIRRLGGRVSSSRSDRIESGRSCSYGSTRTVAQATLSNSVRQLSPEPTDRRSPSDSVDPDYSLSARASACSRVTVNECLLFA